MIFQFDRLTLIPDGEGAALTVPLVRGGRLDVEEETSVRGDGTEGVDARRFTLEADTASDAAAATLERWSRAGRSVRALAVGLDGHAAWSEAVPLRLMQTERSGRATWRVRLFSALRDARIHRRGAVNLIADPAFHPRPAPGGYAAVDPVDLSLTQYLDDGDYEVVWMSSVPCGPGAAAAASVSVLPGHTLGADEATVYAVALSHAGTVLASQQMALGGIGAISTPLLTTPTGTVAVAWQLAAHSDAMGGLLQVETPCLRIAAPLDRTGVGVPVAY